MLHHIDTLFIESQYIYISDLRLSIGWFILAIFALRRKSKVGSGLIVPDGTVWCGTMDQRSSVIIQYLSILPIHVNRLKQLNLLEETNINRFSGGNGEA